MGCKVMTFNVENLFHRFDFGRGGFKSYLSVGEAVTDPNAEVLAKAQYNALQEESRTFTALTIANAEPDVVCLQEVESLRALDFFHDTFLRRMGRRSEYKYRMLIEGNDPRGIDVAILSRHKITRVVSHRDRLNDEGKKVFSRDCLEVDVKFEGKPLTLFVNHFKSMVGGRDKTMERRQSQAQAVADIINERFGDAVDAKNWLVVGDLNDYYHADGQPDPDHALGPLAIGTFCVDFMSRIQDDTDRWTHYYVGGDEYRQLDYILASQALATANPQTKPTIIRSGMPFRAIRHEGMRWPRTGYDRPKASDHCPVLVDIDLP